MLNVNKEFLSVFSQFVVLCQFYMIWNLYKSFLDCLIYNPGSNAFYFILSFLYVYLTKSNHIWLTKHHLPWYLQNCWCGRKPRWEWSTWSSLSQVLVLYSDMWQGNFVPIFNHKPVLSSFVVPENFSDFLTSAKHHMQEKALEQLKVTEGKTVAVGQKMDLVFYTLQLGFFCMDFDLISKCIDKAKKYVLGF